MSEQTGKPVRTGETASKAGRSYPEILQLNQELFKNLQGLIDEDEARKKELLDTKNAYEMAQAEIARLEVTVSRLKQRLQAPLPQQIDMLFQKLQNPATLFTKIAIPTMEGLQMVAVDNIVHCASDSNYTVLTLKDRQKVVASRTLKEIEELLEDYSFLRVHHSNLVNLNEICKYIKGEGGYLVMSDGSSINVSRSRKEGLLRKLQPNRS